MKRTLCLLVVLSFYSLHAQKTVPNKLSIGFSFSPDYSFRSLQSNGGISGDAVKKTRNDMEVAKFGYTSGLTICLTTSSHIAFETGIGYSNKGYKTENFELFYPIPNPVDPVRAKYIYSFKYIGIPLKVKWMAGKGKVRFLSSAGFMTNFLLKAKSTTFLEYPDGRKNEMEQSTTNSFNKIDISPMISAGFDYAVNKNVRLAVEPTFRYGIISIKDTPLKEHLWSLGLNIGIYYSLR